MRKGVAEQAGQRDDLEPPVGGLGFSLFVQIVHVYEYLYCSRYSSTAVHSLATRFLTNFAFVQPNFALFPHSFFRFTNTVSVFVLRRSLARSSPVVVAGRPISFESSSTTFAFLQPALLSKLLCR